MAEVRGRVAEGAGRVYAAGRYRARRLGRRASRRIAGVSERLPGGGGVALTFDDGPEPRFTEPLLDALAELDVRATFFCIGERAREHPELLRRMVAAGHSVGSHSMSHPETWRVGSRALWRELREGHRAVESAIGRQTSLFRPPHGHLDLRVASLIRAAGLRSWLWTVDPRDWEAGADAEGVAAGCRAAEAGDVVLLHDGVADEHGKVGVGTDRDATLAAVPLAVEQIRARGLSLTTLAM